MKKISPMLFFVFALVVSSFHSFAKNENKSAADIDSLNSKTDQYLDAHSSFATITAYEALLSARQINYKKGEASALIALASLEEDSGKYETALKELQSAFELAKEISDTVLMARSIQNTGNIKNRQGNYEEAVEIYMKALAFAENGGTKKIISDLYNNLAVCYLDMQKYDKSLEYHHRALKIREQEGWQEQIAASLQNIGNVYFTQMEDTAALKYFEHSLDIRKKIGDRSGEASSLNCIAAVYVDFELNEKAKALMEQAIAIRKEIGERNLLPMLYGNLADVESMMGKHAAALANLDNALKIAKDINAKRDIRNLYLSYSTTYEDIKDPANALKYYKLYSSYKDSILNEKNSRHVNDLIAKYETSEKENRIKLQESEIGKQKTKTYFLSISFLLVLLVAALLLNRQRLKAQQVLQEEKIKQERLRNQSMIMAQEKERKHIAGELHDGLGQVLSAARLNVEAATAKNAGATNPQLAKALDLIDNSFTELRNISHRMMPVQLIRFGLIAAIQDMVSDINKSGSIHFRFDADSEMPRFESAIEINLFRIVQEWSNNLIKYSKATEVSIQLMYAEGEITMMIEDNGSGFETSKLETGKGNGWYNMNSRLNLINGQIEIDSRINKGTLVSVFVPVNATVLTAA